MLKRIVLYSILVACIIAGMFLIYSISFSYDKMLKVSGKILNIEFKLSEGTRFQHYYLSLTTDTLDYKIRVDIGSNLGDAKNNELNTLLVTGHAYAFYINPTYQKGHISKIESNGAIIYKESEVKNIISCMILLLTGFGGIIYGRKVGL